MILQLLCSIRLQNRGRVDNTYASFFFFFFFDETHAYVILRHQQLPLRHHLSSLHHVVNGMGDGRTSSLITAFAKYFFPPFSASIHLMRWTSGKSTPIFISDGYRMHWRWVVLLDCCWIARILLVDNAKVIDAGCRVE